MGKGAEGDDPPPANPVASDSEEERRPVGLGWGGGVPNTAQVGAAKEAMLLEKQRSAAIEASLKPGLNRGGGDSPSAKERPAKRAPIGPAMPPPPSRLHAKAEEDVPMTEDGYEWKPPTGQRGDGKTSLNEKLGY